MMNISFLYHEQSDDGGCICMRGSGRWQCREDILGVVLYIQDVEL